MAGRSTDLDSSSGMDVSNNTQHTRTQNSLETKKKHTTHMSSIIFRPQVTMDTLTMALVDAAASAEARTIAEVEEEPEPDPESSCPPHKRQKQSDEVTYTGTNYMTHQP